MYMVLLDTCELNSTFKSFSHPKFLMFMSKADIPWKIYKIEYIQGFGFPSDLNEKEKENDGNYI